MNKRHLLSLMLVILIAIPMSGWAQALFDPRNITYEPSLLFPIVPEDEINKSGAGTDPINKEIIGKIYNRCMERVPSRFMPDSHEYYCTCAAAATQGSMTTNDLLQLQKKENRIVGNKVFEKYIHNVMKPCMDVPIENIDYTYCISDKNMDWRVNLPVPYCRCTSRILKKHFDEAGEEEMMISWAKDQSVTFKDPRDPIYALWSNDTLQAVRKAARKECVKTYLSPMYYKN